MKKIYSIMLVVIMTTCGLYAQTRVYYNNFEDGAKDATVVGSGQFVDETTQGFGKVFHNAVDGEAIRTNYLLLPSSVLSGSEIATNKELSICFWVHKGTNTERYWNPIFAAYGSAPNATGVNEYPMLALQFRMEASINLAGWTDLKWPENVNYDGNPTKYTEYNHNLFNVTWLDDSNWHFFTATFTETSVKMYVDGVVQNAWTCDGTEGRSVNGLFTNGSELDYVCLGGNQAWNWGDKDPAFKFDDVAIYANALTVEHINGLMTAKANSLSNVILQLNELGEVVATTYLTLTGSCAGNDYQLLVPGIYIAQMTYRNGVVKSVKVVKD